MPPDEMGALVASTPSSHGGAARPGVTAADIAAMLRRQSAPADATRFAIALAVQGAYFAIDADRHPVLLVPTAPGRRLIGRDAGGLGLSHDESLRFQVGGRSWEAPSVVLTCLDDDLLPTFCALALDVISRLPGADERPSPRAVSDAVAAWERLLRARHRLSPEEELGLWGELWLLSHMPAADAAVDAWRGPGRAAIDFRYGETAIECKTSLQRLRHHVSQRQLERPAGDASVYVVSLWVGADPMGCSLPELVRRVDAAITNSAAFEAKLLDAGYSRSDATLYRQRYAPLEEPLVFPEAAVPRVRTFDPGVSAIRFTVTLDDTSALDGEAAYRILEGPSADA